jgi:hypothetical protein
MRYCVTYKEHKTFWKKLSFKIIEMKPTLCQTLVLLYKYLSGTVRKSAKANKIVYIKRTKS